MSNKRSYLLFFLMAAVIVLIASCAQIVNPTGGPKDRIPPRALKYVPDSAARNFQSKEIAIFFDEYIQLKDANSQLVISPPVKVMPELRVKGRALYIRFNDTLRSNTTYSLNFGSSIHDITEDNALDNFQYVFSTGPSIDSLSLSGKIVQAFDRKTEKGILVMLYDDLSDSVPYKKLPAYFSKTRPDGSYTINNIHPGAYKAFALKDANSNYTYDQGELVGFSSQPVTIGSMKDTLSMAVFMEKNSKIILKKKLTQHYGKMIFVFSGPVDSLQLKPLDQTFPQQRTEYSAQRDTVVYWYSGSEPGQVSMLVKNNNAVLDTAEMILPKKNDTKRQRGAKLELAMRASVSKAELLDVKKSITIELTNPVVSYDLSKIALTKGKDTLKFKLTYIDSVHRKLLLDHPFAADSSYRLVFLKGAFTDMFGLTTDTMNIPFRVQPMKFYGTAKMKADLPAGNYIIQLLTEKDVVVREEPVKGSTTLNYELLRPGNYKIKLIYDENGNGKWDTGDYLKKIQPEKVSFYPGTINIRSNWDLDLEWK